MKDWASLQRWIMERRVAREDEVSEGGVTWETVGSKPELGSFFLAVDQLEQIELARTATPAAPEEDDFEPDPPTGLARLDDETEGVPIGLPPLPTEDLEMDLAPEPVPELPPSRLSAESDDVSLSPDQHIADVSPPIAEAAPTPELEDEPPAATAAPTSDVPDDTPLDPPSEAEAEWEDEEVDPVVAAGITPEPGFEDPPDLPEDPPEDLPESDEFTDLPDDEPEFDLDSGPIGFDSPDAFIDPLPSIPTYSPDVGPETASFDSELLSEAAMDEIESLLDDEYTSENPEADRIVEELSGDPFSEPEVPPIADAVLGASDAVDEPAPDAEADDPWDDPFEEPPPETPAPAEPVDTDADFDPNDPFRDFGEGFASDGPEVAEQTPWHQKKVAGLPMWVLVAIGGAAAAAVAGFTAVALTTGPSAPAAKETDPPALAAQPPAPVPEPPAAAPPAADTDTDSDVDSDADSDADSDSDSAVAAEEKPPAPAPERAKNTPSSQEPKKPNRTARASSLKQRGWKALDQERYRDAEDNFSRALQMNSRDAEAQLGLGRTLFKLKRRNDAVDYLCKAAQSEDAAIRRMSNGFIRDQGLGCP